MSLNNHTAQNWSKQSLWIAPGGQVRARTGREYQGYQQETCFSQSSSHFLLNLSKLPALGSQIPQFKFACSLGKRTVIIPFILIHSFSLLLNGGLAENREWSCLSWSQTEDAGTLQSMQLLFIRNTNKTGPGWCSRRLEQMVYEKEPFGRNNRSQ